MKVNETYLYRLDNTVYRVVSIDEEDDLICLKSDSGKAWSLDLSMFKHLLSLGDIRPIVAKEEEDLISPKQEEQMDRAMLALDWADVLKSHIKLGKKLNIPIIKILQEELKQL